MFLSFTDWSQQVHCASIVGAFLKRSRVEQSRIGQLGWYCWFNYFNCSFQAINIKNLTSQQTSQYFVCYLLCQTSIHLKASQFLLVCSENFRRQIFSGRKPLLWLSRDFVMMPACLLGIDQNSRDSLYLISYGMLKPDKTSWWKYWK